MLNKRKGGAMPVSTKDRPIVNLERYKDARYLIRDGCIYRNLAADGTAPLLARFLPPPNHKGSAERD